MSEKEEKIVFYRTSEEGATFLFPKDAKVMTRAEAVERMAKAIFFKDNVLSLTIKFKELKESQRKFYLNLAEAALDALLKEKD